MAPYCVDFSAFLKQLYLILQLKMTLEKLLKRSPSLRSISFALIFMLKIFSKSSVRLRPSKNRFPATEHHTLQNINTFFVVELYCWKI